MANTNEKNKALETALSQIEKNFGKGAIMRLGDKVHEKIEVISSGSISFYGLYTLNKKYHYTKRFKNIIDCDDFIESNYLETLYNNKMLYKKDDGNAIISDCRKSPDNSRLFLHFVV